MLGRIKNSLQLKWMVFSILLATIPLAIAGFSIIQIYQKDLKKSVIEIEETKASLVVETMQAFLEKVTSNLFFLAKHENLREVSLFHTKEYLENVLYQNDYISELTLLNDKGRETVKVSKYKVVGPSDLKDQSKSEMFRVTSKSQVYYGDVRVTISEEPSMMIAIPIEEHKGKTIGVLTAQIHLQCLWDIVSKTKIGEKGFAYVVDREGNLIAHHDTRLVWMKENVSYLCGARCHIQKESVFEWGWPSGERFLNVRKRIKNLGWTVFVQVPIEEAYEPVRKVANTALKYILIALAVAVILSLFLTRRLIHPIKQLSGEMAKVSKGNLDVHIATTTRDELGLLTESFNQMIRDLKQSHEALKEAEAKYRTIFEDSKDMVYITTVDGEVLDVNQAGLDLFGYGTKEEMMQVYVRDTFLNPEDRKRFRNEIRKEWFVKDFEVKLKRKGGTPIDVLITANARRDDSGNIISYEGTIKDISDRKRMEDELVRRTEGLQVLYELGLLINQTLDLEKVLPIALEMTLDLTGFEMGSIHLLNEDGEILELKCSEGQPPILAENIKNVKFGEGVCGKAVKLKQAIILSIDEYPTPQVIPFLREGEIQSLVGIPLLAKGEAIGAITLLSRSVHTLNQREVNLLESIGNQIGIAIENARLFSAVAKAKSEWETTFDAVTDLITIRDKDYRILRVNKATIERFGMEPREMVGQKCYEILYHKEVPCEGCYVSEALKTKRPASGERESKYLNGVFHYFTFPIFDEAGEVIAVFDMAREITEEKRLGIEKEVINNVYKILASSLDVREVFRAVHSELKKVLDSERMTIVIFDGAGEGFRFFALDKDYEIKELMEGVTYPLKGTPSEKAAQTGLPVIISNTEESDYWTSQKLLKEGIHSILVFPLEYKEKIFGTFNFGCKATSHFSERHLNILQQIVPGLAISIQNSLLLEEMKQSEERYRTVVEGAHDGICVIGKDNRFKYVNHRLAEIFGYLDEELIGMDFRDIVDEESQRLMAYRFTRLERGEKSSSGFELNAVRKDGDIRNIEINAKVMKDSQGEINYIVFVKDITEKKKMEEQLIQTEKLRAIGEMASGVAHDFNNALAVILGNTQLLLYTAKDEGLKESLKVIEKVARDSAQTVRRLQDFTRKRVYQELYKLDINLVVKDSIEITKPKWKDDVQGRGILIEMVSNFEEVPPVVGNASELREVITNMIFNAIEAMPEGGKIKIRTFQKEKNVYIRISDTGIGMTEEVRKKVFEPFFTTKPFSNTGLGLSMSYGIIKRFGGEFEVESKIGHGTTFTIILPIGLEGKEEGAISSIIKKGREARILVIDDEETVRGVLSQILSQGKHRVTVAENGEDGIRLFKEEEFDIVLTDLGMPGMSGWEVGRAIKKMSPHTPVGMITGWEAEVDQAKIKENGIDFVIPKPFQFDQILKVVDETIASKGKPFMT